MSTDTVVVRKKVLNRLREYLGTGEHPPGSNHNFITNWYNDHVDKIGNGPWCEMTATWAMWTGDAKSLKKGRAYTVDSAKDAENKVNGSSWHWGTKGMKAGDQVYYDFGGRKGNINTIDHVGTVEKILSDGTFYVIEGNVGNKLTRMRRDKKFVVGYVRFDWERLLGKIPKDNKPDSLVVDGEMGSKTVSKWQKIMKVKVTGKVNKELVTAVQTFLKNTVDHNLEVTGTGITQDGRSSQTVGALQRYLKTPVNQIIKTPISETVKALQRRLNEDRF